MALKHLQLSDMVGLTQLWKGPLLPMLVSIPQLQPWLSMLDAAHARVERAQPGEATELQQQLSGLAAEQATIDARHDSLVRATSLMIEAERHRCEHTSPERAALCQRAHETLFPEGLRFVTAMYVTEAGNAARIEKLIELTPWLSELLASIPLAGGAHLGNLVGKWCGLARQLSELEGQKVPLQTQLVGASHPTREEITAARHDWIRTMNLLLTSLDMVEGHSEAVEALRAPVLRTSEIASKRLSGNHTTASSSEEPADKPCQSPQQPLSPLKVSPLLSDEIPPGFPGSKPYI